MKVYILILDMGFDGTEIFDVFETKEKAMMAQIKDSQKYPDGKPFGEYRILEYNVK